MTITHSPSAVMALASHHHYRSHSMPLTMTEEDKPRPSQSTPYARPSSKRSISTTEDSEAGYIFGATRMHERLYTDHGNECGVEIQSKMDRGFFLAEDKWTCYRRNYFQLTGTFIVTRDGPFYIGKQHRIRNFYFQLSARQLEADLQVKLIQLTPKRDKGPQNDPPLLAIQPIIVSPPFGTPPVVSGESAMATAATFERIQFKSATANNGKKRASQQFFVLVMELLVELDNGDRMTVASSQSLPLVVRGRSPGHYADSGRRKKQIISPSSSTSSTATRGAETMVNSVATTPPAALHLPQHYNPHTWHPLPTTSAGYYLPPPPPAPLTPQQHQHQHQQEQQRQQTVPIAPQHPHPVSPQLDFSYFAPHGRSQSANVPLIMNQHHSRWDFSPSSSSSGQTTVTEDNGNSNSDHTATTPTDNNNGTMYDTKFFHCYPSYSAALSGM